MVKVACIPSVGQYYALFCFIGMDIMNINSFKLEYCKN